MKAAVLQAKSTQLEIKNVEAYPKPGLEQVQIKFAALNRRDYWITKGMYPGITYPTIMGSDGCGIWKNQKVILNPNQNWGNNPAFQSLDYNILGLPRSGTLSETIFIEEDRIHNKPPHLTDVQAAALPLAGMTAYRALFTKGNAKKGDNVLISGVGGGVALFAMQFAIAVGCNVYVTSGNDNKILKAKALGAVQGVNYTKENAFTELKNIANGFDIIIDSAAGKSFSSFLKICNPGARIVVYGGTTGSIEKINPQLLFWKQVSIHGTTMATDDEFRAMLDFVTENKIIPVVDKVIDLENINDAFEVMAHSSQFGKIVIKI